MSLLKDFSMKNFSNNILFAILLSTAIFKQNLANAYCSLATGGPTKTKLHITSARIKFLHRSKPGQTRNSIKWEIKSIINARYLLEHVTSFCSVAIIFWRKKNIPVRKWKILADSEVNLSMGFSLLVPLLHWDFRAGIPHCSIFALFLVA